MVKATLIIAVLYFLSPIALTKIQAKPLGTDENRLTFFQAPVSGTNAANIETGSLPIHQSLTSYSRALNAGTPPQPTAAPTTTVGLCSSDLSLSASVARFCTAISADELNGRLVPETLMSTAEVASHEILIGCEHVVKQDPVTTPDFETALLDQAVSDWLIAISHPASEQTQGLQGTEKQCSIASAN